MRIEIIGTTTYNGSSIFVYSNDRSVFIAGPNGHPIVLPEYVISAINMWANKSNYADMDLTEFLNKMLDS